jgi:electron transfer flavoprotein beta subunit
MDVVVCVKSVPILEGYIKLNEEKLTIEKEGLIYQINEWDDYALEEALLIKERFGGTVTAITVDSDESRAESLLRECFAKGVDRAIEVNNASELDPYTTAKLLSEVIKELKYDVIFTGVQASDDGFTQVGGILAELLDIPHVSIITHLEIDEASALAKVHQELEAGFKQLVETKLPALFTVQTGINTPRYASFRKIMEASKRDITKLTLELDESEIELSRKMSVKRMFRPPLSKKVELLKGEPREASSELVQILRKRKVV